MPEARERGALRHPRIISPEAAHRTTRLSRRGGEWRVAEGCIFTIQLRRRTTWVAGDSQAAERHQRRKRGASVSPGQRHRHCGTRCSSITLSPDYALVRLITINRWVRGNHSRAKRRRK